MKKFKTKPYAHQLKGLKLSQDAPYFALLCEQGTGKSKIIVDTVAHLWRAGKLDLLVVLAPKGAAPVWIREQIPTHMPDDVPYVAALWKAPSRMTQRGKREIAAVLNTRERVLKVISMNIEAFGSTQEAVDFAMSMLDAAMSAMVVVDESHRIKTPTAHSTKRIVNLRIRSAYRRILTGTVGDKPFDLFSQFGFLSEDILETTSFTAFRNEYAEMETADAGIMRHIARRIPKEWKGRYIDGLTDQPTEARCDADGVPNRKLLEPKYLPPIVKKDAEGKPMYRNLDRLERLIAPYRYRVLKRDCLDLPAKIYSRYYTELSDRQWALYTQVRDLNRIEWEEGRISTFNKLTVYLRLQQIICGYVPEGEGLPMHEIFTKWEDNPRIVSTLDYIADRRVEERAIIWCRYIEDIRRLSEALRDSYGAGSVVQFYGAVKDRDRQEAVARFQGERILMNKSGNVAKREEVPEVERARFMIAQERAGGVSQTWTAANLSFHYSNTFSLIDRLQAEDRPHRIGQRNVVQYTDLEAEDTIDGIIITSLVGKKEVADVINGDEGLEWLK